MARKVIGGNSSNKNKTNESEILLDSLQDLSSHASKKVKLFQTKPKPLTLSQKDYILCSEALHEKLDRDNTHVNVTTRQVCSFFSVQYEHVYGFRCVDFNIFNTQNVFENVKNVLNLDTNLDLLEFVALSFIRFDSASKNLNLRDDRLYVSTFKQPWILQELYEGSRSRKFSGFY